MWKVSVFGYFLVRIFSHLDWIRRVTPYFSAFSPNAGKYGPENSKYGHFLRGVAEAVTGTEKEQGGVGYGHKVLMELEESNIYHDQTDMLQYKLENISVFIEINVYLV